MGHGICLDEVLTKEQQANDYALEQKLIKEDIWRKDHDDMVNHPPHYTQGGVECIDAMEASMDPVEFAGYLKGCVIKYLWRFEKKWDPVEDVRKAVFYLDRLEKHVTKHPDIFKKETQNGAD